jgi:REP element-mobilizing transposase RayT
MPRANRYIADGLIYHITHRCHDRSFLLRFAKDRKEYKARLRDALGAEEVDLLDYCVTSNHVHLLAFAEKTESAANMIQRAHGEMARWYNIRKRRTGAFWEGRYHCTMVEDGSHLMRAMVYIAMNMVRAGVVRHPGEWDWCAYKEIVGERKRYRLVDRDRLFERSGAVSQQDFLENYRALVEEAVSAGDTGRESRWTESLAVGSEDFVRKMGETFKSRAALTIEQDDEGSEGWTVRENRVAFGAWK